MNDILNNLTYSEDRVNGSFKITNTPSKLKLRARTYEGLSNNINKRRKSSFFSIPDAFMAQDVYMSPLQQQPAVQQPQSVYTAPQNNGYTKTQEIKRATAVAAPKKLKTNIDQIRALEALNKNTTSSYIEISNESVNRTPVMPTSSNYNVSPATTSTTTSPVTFNTTTNNVENKNFNTELTSPIFEASAPYQNINQNVINQNLIQDTKIEAAREKVFSVKSENINSEVTNAIETDEFAKLEKMTDEYNVINEEYNKSKKILEDKQQESENTKNELNTAEKDLSKINEKINSHIASIDSAKKDISALQEEMKSVTEKINKKMDLIKAAKEKKLKEKLSVEEEASKLMEEIKNDNKKIDEIKQTIKEKDEEKQSLALEENKVLKQKTELQNEYEQKLEILKAMTLPAEIVKYVEGEESSDF